jgi:hypothetical protein
MDTMKTYALVGFILILIGLAAFVYEGVTYSNSETLLDLSSAHLATERTRTLPPLVGALALAGGIVLLVMGSKRSPKDESTHQYRRWLL